MQTIEVNYSNGVGPFTIYVCNISLDYCDLIATNVSLPPTYTFDLPPEFLGTPEVVVKIIDLSTNCEDFNYYQCFTPTPTITLTPTITPSKIVNCNCLKFTNTGNTSFNYSYIQCNGQTLNGAILSGNTIFACGNTPIADPGVYIEIGNFCVNGSCPEVLPTPTPTVTVTPTLPGVVGYFQDCCDSNNQFVVTNIPSSFSPLSGVYAVRTNEFEGCATYIGYFLSTKFYTYDGLDNRDGDDCSTCQLTYPVAICPTPTTTVTPTNTITPSITPTTGLPPTPTPTITITPSESGVLPTPTPTPTVCCNCYSVKVISGNMLFIYYNCSGVKQLESLSVGSYFRSVLSDITPSLTANPSGSGSFALISVCIGC